MADLSAIDRFYDRVVKGLPYEDLERLERAPASEGIQDPNAVLRPLGSQMTQKEPTTVIDGGEIQPIEYPTGYKPKVPQSEIIRENVNYALQNRQKDARDLSANAKDLATSLNDGKDQMRTAIERLESMGSQSYTPNQNLEDRIKAAEKDMNTEGQAPRDIWSEMILSFGPAIAGALTGEAGALVAPEVQKQGRGYFESMRKEEGEQIKSKRERAQKVYESLLKLREQDRSSFDKGLQREMDRLAKALQGREGLAKLDANDLQRTEDKINAIGKEVSEGIQEGSAKIAGTELDAVKAENQKERDKFKAAEALKRAKVISNGMGLKDATNLRKEFNADPVVKNFKDVQQSYQKIQDLSKSSSPAGDISMVFSYMKMLDPGSVVREGEFATAEKAAGVPDQIRNQYNKLLKGERLNPAQRKDFLKQARSIYDSQQALVSKVEKDYQGLASQYGTSPGLVIPTQSQPLAPVYKDGDTKVIKGQTFVRKDGRWLPKK